ncbi:hypothetical protein Mal15_37690 [Stieleria maiorica]|uniref:Uncharacterized protein n=1 Tax=Stieleria maiorica TaxID=2795974 RepID=A0A5B9MFT9_9BACT|nr:hypothetical protein Mal15_37690 [Stieleria maiorica]
MMGWGESGVVCRCGLQIEGQVQSIERDSPRCHPPQAPPDPGQERVNSHWAAVCPQKKGTFRVRCAEQPGPAAKGCVGEACGDILQHGVPLGQRVSQARHR